MPKRAASFLGATALIVIAALTAYWPGLSGGFVFDDFPNIVNNSDLNLVNYSPGELLRASLASGSGPLRRPLAMLTFAIERSVFGLDASHMKATNVAIHAINACLIFALISRLTRFYESHHGRAFIISGGAFAFLVALAWAVAPINLTGVLYVVQRMESLAMLATIAGLLAYLRGRIKLANGEDRAAGWLWGGIGGGLAVGVLAKESAVMLPVYSLVIEAVFFGMPTPRTRERAVLTRLYVTLLVVPGCAGLAWLLPGLLSEGAFGGRDFTMTERLWTQARVLWHYMAWTLIPTAESLSLFHHGFSVSRGALSPWTTLPAAIGLFALAGAAWRWRRLTPWISFGVLWFFVMHLLVSTILSLELVHEHRNYLGSMGLLAAVMAGLLDRRLYALKVVRGALVTAVVVFLGFTTALRSHQWGDPARLFRSELANNPDNHRARYQYATSLIQRNGGAESEAFQRGLTTLKEMTEAEPETILPWQSLILAHTRHGLAYPDDWWDAMLEHLAKTGMSPTNRKAIIELVNQRIRQELPLPADQIGSLLDTALNLKPGDSQFLSKKASLRLNVEHDMEGALTLLKEVTVRYPEQPGGWRNLTRVQDAAGHAGKAKASLSRLSEVDTLGYHQEFVERMKQRLSEDEADP